MKRSKLTYACQKMCGEGHCKCGWREWTVRLIAFFLLLTVWTITWILLLEAYESYQPPGTVSFSGSSHCVCCWDDPAAPDRKWECYLGELTVNGAIWEEHCSAQWEDGQPEGERLLGPDHTRQIVDDIVSFADSVSRWEISDTWISALSHSKKFKKLLEVQDEKVPRWHREFAPVHVLAG